MTIAMTMPATTTATTMIEMTMTATTTATTMIAMTTIAMTTTRRTRKSMNEPAHPATP